MEFVYGESGDGRRFLYKSDEKDTAVNDFILKTARFNAN
jgi:hypothetical protein